MKNKHSLLFALYIFAFYSCKDKDTIVNYVNQISDTVQVNVNLENSVTIEEGVDTLFFIPLESDEDNIFGTIDKIIVSDSLIFILDNKYSKAIYVFNWSGAFKYKLFSVGNGPGEYLDIFDIDIVEQNLYLSDRGRKILKYKISDGSFLQEYLFDPWGGMEFILTNEKPERILFNRNFGHNDIIEDKLGRSLIFSSNIYNNRYKRLFAYDKEFDSEIYSPNQIFIRHKKDIYLSPSYSYQLYKYSKGNVEPFIYLDFGKNAFDIKKLKNNYNNSPSAFEYLVQNKFIHHIVLWSITKNFMFISYRIGNTNYSLLINLNNNDIIKEGNKIRSSFKHGFSLQLPIGSYNEWFVTTLTAEDTLENIDQEPNDDFAKFMKENNIDSISENGNPILVFYKYKIKNN